MVDFSSVTEWQPSQLLSAREDGEELRPGALLILNQPIESITLLKAVWKNASVHIAADGGANRLLSIVTTSSGLENDDLLKLDAICGDLDSLTDQVRAKFEALGATIVYDPDQYSTDFTKSIKHLRTIAPHHAIDIVCLGGLGGRIDQAMAQLHHLYTFQTSPTYADGRVYLLSTEGITFVLKSGKHRIRVKDEKHVLGTNIGILPLRELAIITTKGLEWDVENWETQFGGQLSTSNYVREEWVDIETDKDILFTIDHTITAEKDSK